MKYRYFYYSALFIFILLINKHDRVFSVDYVHVTNECNLFRDLEIVDYWNKRNQEKLPVYYNHLLSGGYFSMPSARMGDEGELGFGYAKVSPYRQYNLRMQLLDRLEISGSYRIYKGIDDPILTPLGFGDLSDKGANFKFAILHPEDSQYQLPGIAVGVEDFMGTKGFFARYIVLTQVILDYNLELSLGYGSHRIRGFFGGLHWMPFRRSSLDLLKPMAFALEYDAIPYQDAEIERHPGGRVKKSNINLGLKYRLLDHFDFSLSRIRGDAWAFSVSGFYNLGKTQGFLPKIDDPLLYRGPFNNQPLGMNRKEQVMVQEFRSALKVQGFELLEVNLYEDSCRKRTLRFRIDNLKYSTENEVRRRLNNLMAYLVPVDIDRVVVVIDEKGLPIHEYRYEMEYVHAFSAEKISDYELKVLTPLREVTFLNPRTTNTLYKGFRDPINFEFFPRTHSFFGSSKGKFKYALGLNLGVNGFLPADIYYSLIVGSTFISNLNHMTGVDRLNPSQLINVRTDIIRYYQQRGITFEEAYLQKNWNLGRGFFTKLSLGHFEEAYGGVGSEVLYYPVNSAWAVGVQGAVLGKRSYKGLGFTNKVRKLYGFHPTYQKFIGSQLFLNLYYDIKSMGVDFKITAGRFLAKDLGVRYEVTRHFPSGLRVSVWYAHTNGKDRINDKRYYDKGVSLSMPLDIFYTHSERDRWRYGLSAWLRDVAVQSATGDDLYNLIYEARNNH